MHSILFAATATKQPGFVEYLFVAAIVGWLCFRYVWMPINRPDLVRAQMERETEKARQRRAGVGKAAGFLT